MRTYHPPPRRFRPRPGLAPVPSGANQLLLLGLLTLNESKPAQVEMMALKQDRRGRSLHLLERMEENERRGLGRLVLRAWKESCLQIRAASFTSGG